MLNKALVAFRNKDFDEAFALYNQIWATAPASFDTNALINAAFCASQTQHFAEGIAWAKQVLTNYPENERCNEIMAWLYYRKTFTAHRKTSHEEIFECVEQLICLQAKGSAGSLATQAILAAVEKFLHMEQPPFLTLVKWMNHAKPESLDQKPYTKKLPDGNTMELASPLEKYHTLITNLLFLGEYYEECITACNQALATGIHFHHENAIWIERRKAYCQAALQQFDAAAVAYKTLIAKKPVWFIYFEYARVLAHLNQPNEALQNLALAMLAPGPTAMKVHVVGTLTQLLRQLGKHAEADAHQELHKTIYNEKNWRKPLQYQTDSLDQENEAPENETIKQLVAKLRGFWKSVSRPTPVLLKGTVIKMNPGNLSGFIKTTQGLSYYFATGDWMDNHSTPSVGQQVSFALTKRFNKKKQESNDVAILINPLTN